MRRRGWRATATASRWGVTVNRRAPPACRRSSARHTPSSRVTDLCRRWSRVDVARAARHCEARQRLPRGDRVCTTPRSWRFPNPRSRPCSRSRRWARTGENVAFWSVSRGAGRFAPVRNSAGRRRGCRSLRRRLVTVGDVTRDDIPVRTPLPKARDAQAFRADGWATRATHPARTTVAAVVIASRRGARAGIEALGEFVGPLSAGADPA